MRANRSLCENRGEISLESIVEEGKGTANSGSSQSLFELICTLGGGGGRGGKLVQKELNIVKYRKVRLLTIFSR